MTSCHVEGCAEKLTKKGHQLCFRHWKMDRDGELEQIGERRWRERRSNDSTARGSSEGDAESGDDSTHLSSTKLGRHFGLSAARMNLVLAELGWIEKYTKGWTPTEHGNRLGANVRESRQTGIPYVVWPTSIRDNRVLRASIKDILGGTDDEPEAVPAPAAKSGPVDATGADGFRDRFPATSRATDGHLVRSRAELLIDNWLYMQAIVHAYERKLPIEEEVYCDFYLPKGKVYIEYWGLEDDPRYAARKQAKQAIYERHRLNLVELGDDDIKNLDDVLPRMLLKFGIDCT